MQDEQSVARSPGVKRIVYFFVALVVLAALYPAVRWVVRGYTTGLIDQVVGQELPEFELRDLSNRPFSKSSVRGKTVVLNFFRSKCHGCRGEKEDIKKMVREVDPERVLVLGIMVDRVQGFPPEITEATLAEFGYEHPVLMADEAFVDAFHGVGWSQITPITYIADPTGRITRSFRHPYALTDLLAALE